ncbi:MAG TPA: Ig-like domain-containing protein [Polyangiaceae bacterium]|nr:Ig-like domain-containing protein [Polyangiaceae bacterium]
MFRPCLLAIALFCACGDESADSSAGSGAASSAGSGAASGTGGQAQGGEYSYPAPDAWGPNAGPGGPAVAFDASELYQNCAFLDGGPASDIDHHNLQLMYDGYLLMPWAPETGDGGLTFFDVSDPCHPVSVGVGTSGKMRESHSIGFSQIGGRWAVVDSIENEFISDAGGILFWDVSDPTQPAPVTTLELPGFFYPDAYARVTLSVFWQAPYVYVGGADNGVFIVDATDPSQPSLVTQYPIEPTMRVGQVQVIGNLLVVTTAEGPRTLLLDVSDPAQPQPIAGGDFDATDESGMPRGAYFTNTTNGFVFYANKDAGGGLVVWDIHDPTQPSFAGDFITPGNGGYVFVKDQFAFVGQSDFASLFDISNLGSIEEVTTLDLIGDLDTIVPIGNVAVLSVDESATSNQGSAIAPWQTDVDTQAPHVTWVWPPSGSTGLALTSRFGVTFSEFVDVRSAWEGSVRLYESVTRAPVMGHVSTQETIVNFWPEAPLAPNTEYTFEIPAGGIVDYNGNAITEAFTATFTTGG